MRRMWVTLFGLYWMGAAGVHAQPADKVGKFEGYVRSASEAFAAGDLSRAEELFARAYQLHADPRLLYNLALAQERQGKREEALASYRRFLAIAPADHELRARAEKAAIELSTPPDEARPTTPEPEPVPTAKAVPEERPTIASTSSGGRGPLSYTGAGLLAFGVVGAIWGGLELRESASISDELAGLPVDSAWNREQAARYQEGQDAERRGIIAVSAGALLAVGGVALLWWDGAGESSETRLSLAVDGEGAALALGGRF